jgi:hypothetical protein
MASSPRLLLLGTIVAAACLLAGLRPWGGRQLPTSSPEHQPDLLAPAPEPGESEPQPKPVPQLDDRQLPTLWDNLAGPGPKAYSALTTLADHPAQAVALLRQHLRPAQPPEGVAKLIADLDSGDFDQREQATRELAKLGGLAEPALREALAGKPSAEAKRRIEEVLQRLTEPVRDPATLRHIRAVEVLERLASDDARALLRELAQGAPGATLTREARLSLQRLKPSTQGKKEK